MRPIILGICSSFFFAFTFIINRAMELQGGSWMWSASLRYFFMIALLLSIVGMRKNNLPPVFREIRKRPLPWMGWSIVGFGFFYAPLTFASSFAPGWLIAGTWQLTIICGSLLAPLFMETIQLPDGKWSTRRGKIPWAGLGFSGIILLGVILMQFEHAVMLSSKEMLLCIIPMIIAAFAYPLGNRKMMEICENRLDPYQRVLGMTLSSLPIWFLLAAAASFTYGPPSSGQVVQSGLVAILSGVVATVLFFAATDLAQDSMEKMGSVEATQSIQVLFAAWGEIIFLSAAAPSPVSWAGIALVMGGMILHSMMSRRRSL